MRLQECLAGATLEQAKEWQTNPEQWIYCTELMQIQSHAAYADKWVDALEARFEELMGGDSK